MGPAPALLDRRLLFFTGKGGVGKSTVTAATALLAAEHGKRVLLVEVDAKNNLTALFEHAPVGFEPRQVYPGVFAMQMDTEASLREYLKVQARVPVFGRLGPIARAFDFVATAAPGVKEILTVGKVCWELRESLEGRADWDLIVVDAAATGHVISQLDAPRRDPGARAGRPGPQPDRLDGRAALRSRAHRAQRGDRAGGDAGQRDHRAGGTGARGARRPARCRHRQPRAARAVHPRRRRGVRGTARRGTGRRSCRSAPAPVRPRCSTRRGWRCPCAAAVRCTSRDLREQVDLPLLLLPYLFVRDHGLRVTRMVAEALGQELG